MNEKLYLDQVNRIQDAYMFEIWPGAIKTWKQELEHEGISDNDLVKGVDYILNNPKQMGKPNLGTLLEWCGKAKMERYDKEAEKEKSERLHNITETSVATDHGRKALSLIKLFLQGEYTDKEGNIHQLTKRQKIDYMLKMEEFFPGHGWQKESMKLRKYYGI